MDLIALAPDADGDDEEDRTMYYLSHHDVVPHPRATATTTRSSSSSSSSSCLYRREDVGSTSTASSVNEFDIARTTSRSPRKNKMMVSANAAATESSSSATFNTEESMLTVDHALLETLFYNEMLTMGGGTGVAGADGLRSSSTSHLYGSAGLTHDGAESPFPTSVGNGLEEHGARVDHDYMMHPSIMDPLDLLMPASVSYTPPFHDTTVKQVHAHVASSLYPYQRVDPTRDHRERGSFSSVYAEQSLLRDFGVSDVEMMVVPEPENISPLLPQAPPPAPPPPSYLAQMPFSALGDAMAYFSRSSGDPSKTSATIPVPMSSRLSPSFGSSPKGIRHNVTVPPVSQANESAFGDSLDSVSSRHTGLSPWPVGPFTSSYSDHDTEPPISVDMTSTAATMVAPVEDAVEKHHDLVSQFASLASRLGIQLPTEIVRSLSSMAKSATNMIATTSHTFSTGVASSSPTNDNATNDHHGVYHNDGLEPTTADTTTSSFLLETPTLTSPEYDTAPPSNTPLRECSEAAAKQHANQKRPISVLSTYYPSTFGTMSSNSTARANDSRGSFDDDKEEVMPTLSAAAGAGSSLTTNQKRRKKPRLQECEARYQQLQAENETLKRHLSNVTNESSKLDAEQRAAEDRMQILLAKGATGEEMDKAIREMTEMYSDYGRRRQQELAFHLEQLERLAHPTDFTKMGLWTLQHTGSKENPVAGILQKELGITSQQGRKIVEQRKRIRAVCANLKSCFTLIGHLKTLCTQKTRIFHDRMTKCREILDPAQTVKLLVWINRNAGLLDEVCPGWGSERIQGRLKPSSSSPIATTDDKDE